MTSQVFKIEELPEDPQKRFNLAFALLRAGRFETGWALYEDRPNRPTWASSLSYPEWTGQPIKSLLVLPEQGLGDQIQHIRYAAELRRQGVSVTVFSNPVLTRLFQALDLTVLPAIGSPRAPRHDAWAYICSLPARFRADLTNISGAPYLPSKPGGRGIGLAASGNPSHVNDAHRSLPPAVAARLLQIPGVRSLDPAATGAADMEDTARIIDGLELVISVDTAVAHLAGAMGKPCWLLLPYSADWRWLLERSDSPWYDSLRLFRQPHPGDWDSVLDRVVAEIEGARQP